jgi:hypothetical protein
MIARKVIIAMAKDGVYIQTFMGIARQAHVNANTILQLVIV